MNSEQTQPLFQSGAAESDADSHKALGEESLAPQKTRIMGRVSYLLAWFGGCVSIGTFTMGSSVVGTLNLIQATLAIAIGCFVIGAALALNGAAGYKYGIPFMVQARSAFGFSGTRLPGLVRAVPAIVWYGFQSWIGAGALNMVSATLFGFDNLIFFFVAFQLLQIGLSVMGFQGSNGSKTLVAPSSWPRWCTCFTARWSAMATHCQPTC